MFILLAYTVKFVRLLFCYNPGPKVGWGTHSSEISFCKGFFVCLFVLFFFPVTQELEELEGIRYMNGLHIKMTFNNCV